MKPLAALLLSAFALCPGPARADLDVAGLDRSIDPCSDFYRFANRRWLESQSIPPDRATWGTFTVIEERNLALLKAALEEGLKSLPPPGSPQRKVVQFFASGMDREAIERAGLSPIEPELGRISAAGTQESLAPVLARLHASGIDAGFQFAVRLDQKDSTRYLPNLSQGGLGMPDRDYYFFDDERSREWRAAYRRVLVRLLELSGDAPGAAAKHADAILEMEAALARASMTAVERRDVDRTYNKMSLGALEAAAPGFAWRAYFSALGLSEVSDLVVAQPQYLKAFAELAAARSAGDWQAYLRWHLLRRAAPTLSEPFETAWRDFYERTVRGIEEPPPRWRHVVAVIGGPRGGEPMGEALGRLWVDSAFTPQAKARALELVDNVKAALRERLRTLGWMGGDTRRQALEKLDAMNVKIGYPERWRDYTDADVGRHGFARNWLNANAYRHRREIARIGRPVDKSEWFTSPHIVNAFYNGRFNEIVFPAGILQPPLFDANADDAVNYGGIGMVIGHEITHGFDDRGRRFDARGNLRDWWTAQDARRYQERARRIERQFGAFVGVEGIRVNGRLTLGENISDIGGLKLAYLALQKALAKKPAAPIDGLTADQRFFIAFGQGWRRLNRAAQERLWLQTDSHSPARFRVKGPLAHMPEFARAFSCDPATTLLAESDRANLW